MTIPADHGFEWIGQPWDTCDRCGQPASEHPGMALSAHGRPFGPREEVIVGWRDAARRMPLAARYGLLQAVGLDPETRADDANG